MRRDATRLRYAGGGRHTNWVADCVSAWVTDCLPDWQSVQMCSRRRASPSGIFAPPSGRLAAVCFGVFAYMAFCLPTKRAPFQVAFASLLPLQRCFGSDGCCVVSPDWLAWSLCIFAFYSTFITVLLHFVCFIFLFFVCVVVVVFMWHSKLMTKFHACNSDCILQATLPCRCFNALVLLYMYVCTCVLLDLQMS